MARSRPSSPLLRPTLSACAAAQVLVTINGNAVVDHRVAFDLLVETTSQVLSLPPPPRRRLSLPVLA